ncbi:Transmembrane protein 41B [Intoshia linei]|uniref:Transmembrane protein 41B n=1 Tax=Intoshia linei TaxID=1819745 RepID=A0A177AYL9_9BILA|nr:Transmembrane protein 41B [Intoshia linei]
MKERPHFVFILLFVIIFAFMLYSLYFFTPSFKSHELQDLRLPRNIDQMKKLANVLILYKNDYFYNVLYIFILIYIILQTFAIPGSIFLSIISGFLFPIPLALIVVCSCSAIGATLCYYISMTIGKRLILTRFSQKIHKFSLMIENNKNCLFNYIVFLRVTPFLPNWFINITSPIINVPIFPFFWGTFIGVAPPSFIAIQSGKTLHQLTSTGELMTMSSIVLLISIAVVSIIPVIVKKRFTTPQIQND